MEGRPVGRLSRPHKVRVPDGPDYRWFPRYWRIFWRSLAKAVGAVGRRGISLNPYILNEKPQTYIVYALSHEYLHWLVYKYFDARTARSLDRIGGHGHHNPFFDRLKLCIEYNNCGGVGSSQSGGLDHQQASDASNDEGKGRGEPAPSAAAKRILRKV